MGSGDSLVAGGVEGRADRDGGGVEGKDERAGGGEAGKDDLVGGWLPLGLEEGGGQVTRGGGGSGPSRCPRSGSRLPPPRPPSTFFRMLFLLNTSDIKVNLYDKIVSL